MSRCERCGGLFVRYGPDEIKCGSCQREAPPGASIGGAMEKELVSNLSLRPKTLTELWSMLATTQGMMPMEFLCQFGIPKGMAKRMAAGMVVIPSVAVAIMEKTGMTPGQFVELMRAQARVPVKPKGKAAAKARGEG